MLFLKKGCIFAEIVVKQIRIKVISETLSEASVSAAEVFSNAGTYAGGSQSFNDIEPMAQETGMCAEIKDYRMLGLLYSHDCMEQYDFSPQASRRFKRLAWLTGDRSNERKKSVTPIPCNVYIICIDGVCEANVPGKADVLQKKVAIGSPKKMLMRSFNPQKMKRGKNEPFLVFNSLIKIFQDEKNNKLFL